MFFRTIQFKIFIFLLIFIITGLVAMNLIVSNSIFNILRTDEMNYNVETTNRTKQRLESTLVMVYNTAQSIAMNKDIIKVLKEGNNISSTQITEIKNTTSTLLQMYRSIQPEYISGIHIIGNNDWQFFSSILSVDESAVRKAFNDMCTYDNKNRLVSGISRPYSVEYSGSNAVREVISFMYPVYNTDDGAYLGTVIADIGFSALDEIFIMSSTNYEDKAMIVSSDGDIIFTYPMVRLDSILEQYPQLATEKKTQFSADVFGKESLIVSDTIDYTDWRIVRMISTDKITGNTQRIEYTALIVEIVFVFFAIISSIIVSRALTKPIKQLARAFKMAESGDFSTRVIIKSHNELRNLGDSFNVMVEKLGVFFDREIEIQKKKSNMEFEILQAQINPHFLYNTLDSVKWLAVIQGMNKIADMTTALINLMKYNLSKDSPFVTLAEEMESVENYITIQKFRYGDIFKLQIQVAPETLKCVILRFVLQPLVENCILHGFNNTENIGIICITSYLENNCLHIKVIDNGIGMDVERVMNQTEREGRRLHHIGIRNIQERIKINYGEHYGLTYKSDPGGGTIAELTMPVNY